MLSGGGATWVRATAGAGVPSVALVGQRPIGSHPAEPQSDAPPSPPGPIASPIKGLRAAVGARPTVAPSWEADGKRSSRFHCSGAHWSTGAPRVPCSSAPVLQSPLGDGAVERSGVPPFVGAGARLASGAKVWASLSRPENHLPLDPPPQNGLPSRKSVAATWT